MQKINTKRIWIAPNQQKMKIMMLIKHLKKQVNKTIREIRKENWYKDKVLRDWILHLIQKKIIMSLKKTVSAFNSNNIRYESIGDKDKNLLIKEYIDIIRPYLSDIINNYQVQGG